MHLPHAIKAANLIVSRSHADDISLLIENHIESHPHWSTPGEARTIFGAVPVWAIIGYLEAVKGDITCAAADYDLHHDAVEAAAAYYHRHRDAIEARISANADTPSLLSV